MALSNRFVRSAIWEGLATDEGQCTPKLIDLMVTLANGGVGLIITGQAYVRRDGQSSKWQLGIDKDELIPGLQAMTREVHKAGGRIVLQLAYGRAYLSQLRLNKISIRNIQDLINTFAEAALRAKKSGFDGVQINYFMQQLF